MEVVVQMEIVLLINSEYVNHFITRDIWFRIGESEMTAANYNRLRIFRIFCDKKHTAQLVFNRNITNEPNIRLHNEHIYIYGC